jgi:hypothetical protein
MWGSTFKSHVYKVGEYREYRDMGDWLLTSPDVHAVTRGDHPVDGSVVQMWQVKNGKVTVMRAFLSEADALSKLGLQS